MEKLNNILKKKIFINDTFQITIGRLSFVSIITTLQFIGMWCDNNWILSGSMFFLVANMFLALGKSTKAEEEKKEILLKENEELDKTNRILIDELRKEITELKERN